MSSDHDGKAQESIHNTNFKDYKNYGQHASNSGVIVNNNVYQMPADLLELLLKHCSLAATFDSLDRFNSPRYDGSTWPGLIQDIEQWVEADEGSGMSSSLFWLHGDPKVGKSGLAQTLSEKFDNNKQLAASFFFFGTDPKRNAAKYLIPTLVWQLVNSFEGLTQPVEDNIRRNRALFTKIFRTQMQELLIQPLLALKSAGTQVNHPRLIVVDGLDECQSPDDQCELLRVIALAIASIPYPLRFLITSRPEPHISRIFNHEDLQAITVHQYNLSGRERKPEKRNKDILQPFHDISSAMHRLVNLPFKSGDVGLAKRPRINLHLSTNVQDGLATASLPPSSSDLHLLTPGLLDEIPGRSRDDAEDSNTSKTKRFTPTTKWGRKWLFGQKEQEKGRGISPIRQETPEIVITSDSRSTHSSRGPRSSSATQERRSLTVGSRSATPSSLRSSETTSSLATSAHDRRVNDSSSSHARVDTTERLQELRRLMLREKLDYYIVLSEDVHGAVDMVSVDKRREFITGFTGCAGQAIITSTNAYLLVDSKYEEQSRNQIDDNWTLVCTLDWIPWLAEHAKDSRIGIDSRTISHEEAVLIKSNIERNTSKLVHPLRNLIDLTRKDAPSHSQIEELYLQSDELTGRHAVWKLTKLREWIKLSRTNHAQVTRLTDVPVAALITALHCIAYTLNLRGSDIPYHSFFHSYLFVGLDSAILFVNLQKLNPEVTGYLDALGVQQRDYDGFWTFLRRREWGGGRVLIPPQISYDITLRLTAYRYIIAPSYIEEMMRVKNYAEIEFLKKACLHDSVSFVRFLSWLETKIGEGYPITEYEAASRLTEYRKQNKRFVGLTSNNSSAYGPNTALPYYSPDKSVAAEISMSLPYSNDSGANYLDGVCRTARTVHFGQPTSEMREAYTRVLQSHIAIDTATFPAGKVSGKQLEVLAQRPFWKDGFNYEQGASDAFLVVHDDPHRLQAPLVPGNVVSNGPRFYLKGQWGMRIESMLVVRNAVPRGDSEHDIGCFERLTCVPIQTRMLKESMLTEEERVWIQEHNQWVYDKVAPHIKTNKRALSWLRRETETRNVFAAVPRGIPTRVEWD